MHHPNSDAGWGRKDGVCGLCDTGLRSGYPREHLLAVTRTQGRTVSEDVHWVSVLTSLKEEVNQKCSREKPVISVNNTVWGHGGLPLIKGDVEQLQFSITARRLWINTGTLVNCLAISPVSEHTYPMTSQVFSWSYTQKLYAGMFPQKGV